MVDKFSLMVLDYSYQETPQFEPEYLSDRKTQISL